MLDYFYHMTCVFFSLNNLCSKNVIILSLCIQRVMDVITVPENL